MATLSPKFPLQLSTLDGTYEGNKTFSEMIEQNFKNLLLTVPGERVMDVSFGVGLRTYFFEQHGSEVQSTIAAKIREQAGKYMPFLQIQGINFVTPEHGSPHLLGVEVEYVIPALKEIKQVFIERSAQGT